MQISNFDRWVLAVAAAFAMLAVLIGAFAAHGLKQSLSPDAIGIIETAVRYQMYHALALFIVALVSISGRFLAATLKLAAMAFASGIILFSGSLYLVALTGTGWFGAITPIGGIGFILGWLALLVCALRA